MLTIPSKAIFHLQASVITRLARWIEIQNSLAEEDDWPEDYDPNDIPIYMSILKVLLNADYRNDHKYPYSNGKFLWFMTMLIPEYVEKNMSHMSDASYKALKQVYVDGGGKNAFPEWRSAPEKE
jgi:hypothetical protein